MFEKREVSEQKTAMKFRIGSIRIIGNLYVSILQALPLTLSVYFELTLSKPTVFFFLQQNIFKWRIGEKYNWFFFWPRIRFCQV